MEQKRLSHHGNGDTSFSMQMIMQDLDIALSQARSAERVLSAALNAAVRLSGADAAFIGLIEGDTIVLKHTFGDYANVPQVDAGSGVIGRVIRSQRAEYAANAARDAGSQAQMALPLLSHETLLGILNLETADPEKFPPELFEFMQFLTARVATALDNARLYELSQAQLAELRQLEQLKTDLIRVATHDIRSPLSVVNSYLEILAEDFAGAMTDEHRFMFDAMFTAIHRMQRMATNILTLDRVQSAHDKPESIVYLDELARNALRDIRDVAQRNGHTLHASLPDEPLAVYGFETELHEAIDNLLSNAIKYTPEGGHITLRLQRLADADCDWAVLEVEDDGIGIAEADQTRLFQPFYRVKTRRTEGIDGIGLGLYVVKRLVEFHGGSIRFRSRDGQGSVFGFQLPLAKAEEE